MPFPLTWCTVPAFHSPISRQNATVPSRAPWSTLSSQWPPSHQLYCIIIHLYWTLYCKRDHIQCLNAKWKILKSYNNQWTLHRMSNTCKPYNKSGRNQFTVLSSPPSESVYLRPATLPSNTPAKSITRDPHLWRTGDEWHIQWDPSKTLFESKDHSCIIYWLSTYYYMPGIRPYRYGGYNSEQIIQGS